MQNQRYGLIGKTLKHTFSKEIHAFLADYNYEIYELKEDELESFVKNCPLNGFNVTIPYKKEIIKYLDVLSESAKELSSVNTVLIKDGVKYGFNTDLDGMEYMIKSANISLNGKRVMILGSGGTGVTARALAKRLLASEIVLVSRNGEVNYSNLTGFNPDVIINTTPVGMYPDFYSSPVNVGEFKNLSGVIDVIYNPLTTKLVYSARERNIKAVNGLSMLVAQASKSTEIWTGKKTSSSKLEEIISKIALKNSNIVLIGMPGAGKTLLAKKLSMIIDKEVIDTDKLIEKKTGKSIKQIFIDCKEDGFRKIESEIIKEVCTRKNCIISTGGGAPTIKENVFPLKMNSKVVWVKRDLNELSTLNRPLSIKKGIDALYKERKEIYEKVSDFSVENNGSIEETVKGVLDKL